jgi:hypothetical protein
VPSSRLLFDLRGHLRGCTYRIWRLPSLSACNPTVRKRDGRLCSPCHRSCCSRCTSTENNCIRAVLHSILNYKYIQYNNSRAVSAGAEEHAASEGTAAKELWHRRTSQGARAACPPRYVIRTYIHTYTHTYIHTQTHTSCVPRYHTKNITQSQTKNNRRTKRRKIGYII